MVNQMNVKKNVIKLVLGGLLAALVVVSTMVISIPTPTKGYINLGDCFVNISAWLLGPIYGAAAAGIGSMLADLFLGYSIYAPATLIIKALMAVASFYVYILLAKRTHGLVARIAASVCAELVMIVGYLVFESFLYKSFIVAAGGVLANVMQGIGGIVISVILYEALIVRIPFVKKFGEACIPRAKVLWHFD